MRENVVEQKSAIPFLDSVRAAATILVFVFHVGYLFSYSKDSFVNWERLVYFSGTVGVSVFFVLSGFLLFYQLSKDDTPLTKEKLKEYTKKRLLRILPLYYFSIFFITVILEYATFFTSEGVRSILFNIFFLREIKTASGGGTIPINPVYWSLVVEMHFYILLPIFYYFFHKYKKISLFIAVIIAGIVYRVILVTAIENPSMQFMRLTPANFDFFGIGMLGAYLYLNHRKIVEWFGKVWLQIVFLVVFVLLMRFYDFDFYPTTAYIWAATLLGSVTMMLMFSFLGNERTIVSRVVTMQPVRFIAKISFSIYIWHAVIFTYVGRLTFSNNIKIILNIIITLVVSTITYYMIEAPFMKFKTKRQRKQSVVSAKPLT